MEYVTKRDSKCGELHIVMGPMYSGKSTKLIETYNTLLESYTEKSKIVVVTHSIETRYSMDKLSSHDRKEVECTKVSNVQSIVNACTNNVSNNIQLADFILIDEAQFFTDLIKVIELVETYQKTVYVYGLDGDFKRNKFGSILDLIPYCDSVVKLNGKCFHCDNNSHFSWRITKDKTTQVIVGSSNEYVALCRGCYSKSMSS